MSARRSKAVKHSSLEEIHGIGERKAKILLSAMKNITAIKNSSADELEKIKGISHADAVNIYEHYHSKKD